jgi:tetratricopeptide (TPR) repeat protein
MPRHVSLGIPAAILWAAALSLAGIASAGAAVVVLGNSMAHDCYLHAKSGIDPRGGIAVCNGALEEGEMGSKDIAATHVNRGVLYDLVGRNPEAFDDFNVGIRRNPELGDGYLNRGVSLIRMKRYDDAFADIQKAITLEPTEPAVAYYDLAVVEEDLGRVRDAYFDYKHALEILPGYTPASEALTHFTVTIKPKAPASGT